MSLSSAEQKNLYLVITSFIGEDLTIKSYQNSFSELTIKEVENMIHASENCNKAMKDLIVSLITGGRIPMKNGWLKRSLSILGKALKAGSFNGAGCQNGVKARWKSPILSSCV